MAEALWMSWHLVLLVKKNFKVKKSSIPWFTFINILFYTTLDASASVVPFRLKPLIALDPFYYWRAFLYGFYLLRSFICCFYGQGKCIFLFFCIYRLNFFI